MATPRTFPYTNGDFQVANVPMAASTTPTQAEFNALIQAFIDAGIMAPAGD